VVRARVRGDLVHVFGKDIKEIVSAPDADYAYRAFIPRRIVALAISERILTNIDYHNFKNSVPEDDRHDAYLACWKAMNDLQRLRKMPAAKRRRAKNRPQDLWSNR
jgi:hypothetical protein